MLTPAQAFDLEVQIVRHAAGQRRSWVALAERLHAFHTDRAWEQRACESFNEWLAQPEVSIPRGDAYTMIGVWRDLVLEHQVPVSELHDLDLSKVGVVLPAIRDGRPWEDALSDCRVLSRSDLRAEYQPQTSVGPPCPACGRPTRIED